MALTGTHMPGDAGATTDDNLRDLAILDRIPRWAPTTVYDINAQVISPNNDVVKANVGHTSAAEFTTDVDKWVLSTTFITSVAAAALIADQHIADDSIYAPIASSVSPWSTVVVRTTNVGPTSGTTELVVATVPAATFDGSTVVELAFSWYNVAPTVSTDLFHVRLYDGLTAGSGTQVGDWLLTSDANGGSGHLRAVLTPSAGSHTYTARLVRGLGTGTATLVATALAPATISVERKTN